MKRQGGRSVPPQQLFKLALALVIALFCRSLNAAPGELTIGEIKQITRTGVFQERSVSVRGTVTAKAGFRNAFFLQDDTGAIYVDPLANDHLTPGDRVLVQGQLVNGFFAAKIMVATVEVTGRATLPRPESPTFEELSGGSYDCRWIQVRGIVHSAAIEPRSGQPVLVLNLKVPAGEIEVEILNYATLQPTTLVDTEVTLRGATGAKANDRKQVIGVRLYVPGPEYLTVDLPAPQLNTIPTPQISEIQRYLPTVDFRHRIRISGTLTYQSPEHGIYLENHGQVIHVQTTQTERFQLGDTLTALGFAKTFGYSPGLEDAQITKTSTGKLVQPIAVDASQVIQTVATHRQTAYDARLVQMTATVLQQVPNGSHPLWLLKQGNTVFQAELTGDTLQAASRFEANSTVHLVGICVAEVDQDGDATSFRLLLRSPADITIASSPFWKDSLLVLLSGLIFLFCAGSLLWYFEVRYSREVYKNTGPRTPQALHHRFRQTSFILARLVWGIAALSLAIIPFGMSSYQNALGSWPTRLLLAITSSAICWNESRASWKRWWSLLSSLLIVALGGVAVWHYQVGSTAVDHLQQAGVSVAVGLCFCLLGLAFLLLRNEKSVAFGQLLLAGVTTVSLLSLLTRLYQASPLVGVARHTAMPPSIAACFLALSAAGLCSKPALDLVKTISSPNLGGVASRRLIPVALLIPILLAWLQLQGQITGLYDGLYGLALLTCANIVSFGSIIWATAAVLNKLDVARSQVEEALRQREERLELLFEKSGIGDYVWNIKEDTVQAHPIVWRLYGALDSPASAPSQWFQQRQHPDDAKHIADSVAQALQGKMPLDIEFRVLLAGGSIRWLSCRGNVVRDSHGQPTHIHGLNIDITALKRSQEWLMKSVQATVGAEEQLKTALDFSKVAIWRWKTAEDHITWSGPVQEIFAHSPSALSKLQPFLELILPDDRVRVQAAVAASLETGRDFRMQYRISVRDQVRWIAARAGVISDEAGLIAGMSGVCFDITSTKVAEERLRESERSFRELADAMPHIVWTANSDGVVDYFNQRWREYTGCDDYDPATVVHPDDWDNFDAAWLQSLSDGVPFQCEMRIKRFHDQTFRWHLSRGLPILDTNRNVVRWFGTSTDIDDYKLIQNEIELLNKSLEQRVEQRSAELAEVEARYRILVDSVKDYAIFMLDPEGHVKSWNKGAQQILGYATSEVVGQHFSIFYTPQDQLDGRPQDTLKRSLSQGRHADEGWRVRKDGSHFWASVVTTPLLDAKGNLTGFSRIMRDLTEQRKAITLLVAERQKAESANQAKSNFLASMSHEIRTPMNAILGMADLLAETDLDETQSEYVHRFQRAGSNLMAIINDILDLSKIESGHFELEQVPFELEELVQRIADLLAPKAHQNKVNLAYRIVPGLDAWFTGDPNRLQQILLNLLSNAVKFTQDGEIVLSIRQHPDGVPNHLQFEVSDTGIGIPPEKIPVIFDDFTQAETSTTRRFGGTGLGLGIARRLVQRMGGVISVESEVGKGSTFTFDALLHKAEQQSLQDHKTGALQDLTLQRVLIVDRSMTNQLIYREMCSSWNMRTEVTSSALKAIQMLKLGVRNSAPFSIVLLDRFTSDLDAFEAQRQIQSFCPGLPVILTTTEDQPGEATRSRAAGFAGFLVKPIRRANLLRTISWSLMEARASDRTSGDVAKLASAVARKTKILVADDSDDNRFLIQAYLAGSNYEALFVTNGGLAVAEFARQQFDLVLMDIQMPVMDGLQATTALRTLEVQHSRRPVPIIALTASATPDDIQRSKAVGCNTHLSKPISKADLLRALDNWGTPAEAADSDSGISKQTGQRH